MKIILLTLLLLLTFNEEVYALPTSQHIALSLLLTKESINPYQAFFISFTSHAVSDYLIQDYVFDIFNYQKNIDYIMVEGLLSGLLINKHWNNEISRMAIIGSVLPDLIDGILVLIDNNRFSNGNYFFPFHDANHKKPITKEITTGISIILFSISYNF